MIRVEKLDEVYMRLHTDDSGIYQELWSYFAFRPANFQYDKRFKNKMWDGYIRLFNTRDKILYIGLLNHLQKFCDDREYKLKVNPSDFEIGEDVSEIYGYELGKQILATMEVRDYQNQYVVNCIQSGRSISLSPTSSGKSFILYLLHKYYNLEYNLKTLIIVPRVNLVEQLNSDFIEYGCDPNKIATISSGKDKHQGKEITITTWHSIVDMSPEWFDQFGVILGDEVHTFQAKSLISIMHKATNIKFKHGFTGTLDKKSAVHKLVLTGLFGDSTRYISTTELIKQGYASELNIKALILNYPKEDKRIFKEQLSKVKKEQKYFAEREFLVDHPKRNLYLKNLLHSLKYQNNLILFDLVEKHGKKLAPLFEKEGRELRFIYGGTSTEERELLRHEIENTPLNEKIVFHFDDFEIICEPSEPVHLANGSSELAINITKEHDISDEWIRYKHET